MVLPIQGINDCLCASKKHTCGGGYPLSLFSTKKRAGGRAFESCNISILAEIRKIGVNADREAPLL